MLLKEVCKKTNKDFLKFTTKIKTVNSQPDIVLDLSNKIKHVGNSGFVRLVDSMPRIIPNNCKFLMCDYAVVQAARVSFNEGIKTCEKDVKLIDFLVKHKHTSPFEMVKFKFHIKCVRYQPNPYQILRKSFENQLNSLPNPLEINSILYQIR